MLIQDTVKSQMSEKKPEQPVWGSSTASSGSLKPKTGGFWVRQRITCVFVKHWSNKLGSNQEKKLLQSHFFELLENKLTKSSV